MSTLVKLGRPPWPPLSSSTEFTSLAGATTMPLPWV
jgi:hypothetical protein